MLNFLQVIILFAIQNRDKAVILESEAFLRELLGYGRFLPKRVKKALYMNILPQNPKDFITIKVLKNGGFPSDFTSKCCSCSALNLNLQHLPQQGRIACDMHGLIMRSTAMKLVRAVADTIGQYFHPFTNK